jgi:hypothetical protein
LAAEGAARGSSQALFAERIQRPYTELFEVAEVPGYHRQILDKGDCRDHGIFDQMIGSPTHQARPTSETIGVHRRNSEMTFVSSRYIPVRARHLVGGA